MIFLPLAVVVGLWTLLAKGIPDDVLSTIGIGPVIVSLAVGLAVLCLVGEKIGKSKWFISCLFAIIILIVVGYSGTVFQNAGRMDAATKIGLTNFWYWAAALLLAVILTALNCRNKYSNKRFVAFFLLWSIVSQILFLFLYAGLNWTFVTGFIGKLSAVFILITIMGAISGIILFLITLPYLALAFTNEFYQSRFKGCFNLPATQKE